MGVSFLTKLNSLSGDEGAGSGPDVFLLRAFYAQSHLEMTQSPQAVKCACSNSDRDSTHLKSAEG